MDTKCTNVGFARKETDLCKLSAVVAGCVSERVHKKTESGNRVDETYTRRQNGAQTSVGGRNKTPNRPSAGKIREDSASQTAANGWPICERTCATASNGKDRGATTQRGFFPLWLGSRHPGVCPFAFSHRLSPQDSWPAPHRITNLPPSSSLFSPFGTRANTVLNGVVQVPPSHA